MDAMDVDVSPQTLAPEQDAEPATLPNTLPRFEMPGKRIVHYSWRRATAAPGSGWVDWQPPHCVKARCEVVIEPTGTTTWATRFLMEGVRCGTIVAGNSGRPGGACGLSGAVDKIHSGHTTQEEDLVSNWMLTASRGRHDRSLWDVLYQQTIDGSWGLDPHGACEATIQGVHSYRTTVDPRDYGDAWLVPECRLSAKLAPREARGTCGYDVLATYESALIFVAGPNANIQSNNREPSSSMRRTFSEAAHSDYEFFKQGVAWALRAGLDAMIMEGLSVALVALVSAGLYAGPHQRRIGREYVALVNALLDEPIGPTAPLAEAETSRGGGGAASPHRHQRQMGAPRGNYFERVVLVKLK